MQHSSMALFCDECGLANGPAATHCSACQRPLTRPASASTATPTASTNSALPSALEVTPGSAFAADGKDMTGELQPGTVLADTYQIREEIGRGGFSIVYRAIEVGDRKRQVAIKRIPLSRLTPAQIIDATETFNREVSMLKRFTGTRGVPKFYGHLVDPENWYLVMEYIRGETLEDRLQKRAGGYFDETTTVELGIKLAQIFYGLHMEQPPVIFRDVKPANIMLTPHGELYLIDFGIARNYTWGKAKDTTPLGSPGYAPPEQYGRAQTNRRTDIYGLGATLQTLVTGRDPLELAAGEPARNPQILMPEFRALLDEMLASDPEQRPVDMLHVQTRLENILQPPLPVGIDVDGQHVLQNAGNRQLFGCLVLLLSIFLFTALSLVSVWFGIIFLVLLACSAWLGRGP